MKQEILKSFLNNEIDIEGWFFPGDMISLAVLNLIQTQRNITGEIFEVGVFKGKSFSFLSHLIQENEKLFGYDLFLQNTEEMTKLAVEKYGAKVDYELVKGDTSDLEISDIKNKINNKKIRLLHIDAGHEYFEVLNALNLFSPFVIDNGIIVMDDYQDPEFPGIEAAVLDFCEIDRPRRFVPFFSGQNKIYLTTNYSSMFYQKSLLGNLNFKDKCRLSIVRDFSILKGFSKLPKNNNEVIQQIDEFESFNLESNNQYNNDTKFKSRFYSQQKYGFETKKKT